MVGEKKLHEIAKKVLGLSSASLPAQAGETEVVLFVTDHGLTRFANSQIHQNVVSEDLGISVRVVESKRAARAPSSLALQRKRPNASREYDTSHVDTASSLDRARSSAPLASRGGRGARIGVASTNSFADSALRDVVRRAENLAKFQKEDPHFQGLPKPSKYREIEKLVNRVTPQARAQAVSTIIKKAKEKKITASGAFDSVIGEVAIANSHGVWAYHVSSASDLSTILLGKTSTGFGAQLGRRAEDINAGEVAKTAIDKVVRGANPIEVFPGKWDVILEPQAVNEMMGFFSWLGPNARIYHEQASHLSGRLGQKIAGENITITDDPLDPEGFPMPFDFEGAPKEKLTIIERGVLKNLVYDSYHAAKHQSKNTGHALPAPNIYGPMPLHLKIKTGKKSLEDMIKGVKKGLLVTRFWYVRVLNPRSLLLTGMTRDGTFLIKNGEIAGGVKNLRFNQSIPEALANVVEISDRAVPLMSFETEIGTNRMPALLVRGWNFTSGTEF